MEENRNDVWEIDDSGKVYVRAKEEKYKLITACVFALIFLASAIVLGILYANSVDLKNQYGNSLEMSYDRAVYELVDNINDIELNLNKTSVSGSENLQRKYLQLVCDNCKYAESNLGQLPVSMYATREGVKFINQVDGYCTSLISQSRELSSEEKAKIEELTEIVVELKAVINQLVEKLLQGYSILNGSVDADLGIDNFSANFDGFSSDSISYPSMIFDGPFSDSLNNKEIKGLTDIEVSEDVARKNLESILNEEYAVKEIKYLGETKANFDTFDYEIILDNNKIINAQMAKRAGFLLTFIGQVDESEDTAYSLEESRQIAKDFCAKAGASDMEMVWSEEAYGIAVLNMAPILNKVILYPDLIKVKVDMSSGIVVGYEAQNYAYNHTEREEITPSLGATDARNLLDARLNINEQRLCIMPLEYGGEILAYEFDCEFLGERYFVYINALNGDEERVMKVVSTQEGALVS